MLDGVIDYLPAPTEVPAVRGIVDDEYEAERASMTKRPLRRWHLRLQPTLLSAL